MKIIRNYILKDFLLTFLFSILIFISITTLGNIVKITDLVIRKGVNLFDAMKIFLVFIPFAIRFTIPLAVLLGVLLTIGNLMSENEIIAINIAGISIFKILNIFLIIGIIFSLILFILNGKIIPEFQYKYRSIIKDLYSKNIDAIIEPGVFLENFKNYILYISDKDQYSIKNIFIYEIDENKNTTKVIFAKRGRFVIEDKILKLDLEDGFRDEMIEANKKELYRMNFRKFFIDIPISEEKKQTKQKPSDMTLKELKEKINEYRKKNIQPIELIAEFQQRLTYSFSVITFILLGFGLALKIRHRQKSINFAIAFLSAAVFYLLFILGQTLTEHRIISPYIAMWLPNFIMSLFGGFLIYKNAYYR